MHSCTQSTVPRKADLMLNNGSSGVVREPDKKYQGIKKGSAGFGCGKVQVSELKSCSCRGKNSPEAFVAVFVASCINAVLFVA